MSQDYEMTDWAQRYEDMRRNRGEPAREIDEDRFYEMLEVLPPAKWSRLKGFECFMVIEAQTEDLYTWCARITENGRESFWEMIAPGDSTINEIHLKISIARWGSTSS
jgi:hypothetical protein